MIVDRKHASHLLGRGSTALVLVALASAGTATFFELTTAEHFAVAAMAITLFVPVAIATQTSLSHLTFQVVTITTCIALAFATETIDRSTASESLGHSAYPAHNIEVPR